MAKASNMKGTEMNTTTEIIECPNHRGAFDCTSFCNLCEGEQEIEVTDRVCFSCNYVEPVAEWHALDDGEIVPLCAECRLLGDSPCVF